MRWFGGRKVPEVKVEGRRFTILPQECEVIDVDREGTNLPVVRQAQELERLAPKAGYIPEHSWGV